MSLRVGDALSIKGGFRGPKGIVEHVPSSSPCMATSSSSTVTATLQKHSCLSLCHARLLARLLESRRQRSCT